MDALDRIIAVLIILFILSLITEKITYFIRKNANDNTFVNRFFSWLLKVLRVENAPNLPNKSILEIKNIAENDVNILSFFIGTLVAFAFKVSLFSLILSDNPSKDIGWESLYANIDAAKGNLQYIVFTIQVIIGIFFTGFFLSFGSRFFHDLLDTFFEIKQLRRKMVDKITYEQDNANNLKEWLKLSDEAIVNKAVEKYNEKLVGQEGILGIGKGYKYKNGVSIPSIQVFVKDEITRNKIHTTYPVILAYGEKEIEVDVFISGTPKLHGIEGKKIIVPNGGGTACCVVKQNNTNLKLLLSCCHVLDIPPHDNIEHSIIFDSDKNRLGSVLSGVFNKEIDAALMLCQKPLTNDLTKFNKTDLVTYEDAKNRKKVFMDGGESGKVEGVITGWKCRMDFPTTEGAASFINLIAFSQCDAQGNPQKPLSQPGDSGSPIYDENKNLLAMLIGGDSTFSYAIQINTIFEHFNLSIHA